MINKLKFGDENSLNLFKINSKTEKIQLIFHFNNKNKSNNLYYLNIASSLLIFNERIVNITETKSYLTDILNSTQVLIIINIKYCSY